MNISDKILIENEKRNFILDAPYNPITGEGSSIKRQLITFNDFPKKLYFPIEMLNTEYMQRILEYKNLHDIGKILGITSELVYKQISELRIKHDFEFWAADFVKIKPKKGGDFIPFKLNYPQRLLHNVVYDQIVNLDAIIRLILLKSRQFGGSTYLDIMMAYIQIVQKTNWNSLIAAHLNQAAINIRYMIKTLSNHYPKDIDSSFELKSFENTHNIKIIPSRNCKITVGSIETPESIRADDVALAHLTEISSWKKTEGKSPEDLCQSILGTIPIEPWSMYVLESTAKGVGNFFHHSWKNAIGGINGLAPVFIGWHQDPKNRIYFKTLEKRDSLIKGMTQYEEFLWQQGATLEGIQFYRHKLKEMEGNEWRMKSEFPTTANEAFQNTGERVFSPVYLAVAEKDCIKPEFKGDVFADGRFGKEALQNIRFDESPDGKLWIWAMPDRSVNMDYRYCAFGDIGGTSKDADYSIIKVFDRYWMLDGGDPEVVAVWHGHIDQDLFAWKCAQICTMYNDALLAIEINSLDKEKTEGDHFYTVLDEIAPYYRNLYLRNDFEKVDDTFVPKYGWASNSQTKGQIIGALNKALRERYNKELGIEETPSYVERDQRAIEEMSFYENKPNGSQGAVDGGHDDHVIVTAGGVWLSNSFMPKPILRIDEKYTIKKMQSEASF